MKYCSAINVVLFQNVRMTNVCVCLSDIRLKAAEVLSKTILGMASQLSNYLVMTNQLCYRWVLIFLDIHS